MNKKIRITLIKSTIGKAQKHKDIVTGLGLRKLNMTVERDDTLEIRGMISKIDHMLHVA